MEKTTVVIVGAGPSGLAMGLALAKHKIHSLILEKEQEIDHDPRGVYLNGDAVRILYDLGLDQWDSISYEPKAINFHRSSFKNRPFYVMDAVDDFLGQAVPNGLLHVQPRMEAALVALIDRSEYCSLRRGCTVESRKSSGTTTTISYTDPTGSTRSVTSRWIIGADGKRGVVRKYFLEPTAGIKQENSDYRYEGTWVAANLRISLPTRDTHPQLPFWSVGMTPEDVYELYWPKDWHFCTPPGKPTAGGRFGPYTDRLWRHEFAEHGWDESMDAASLLWEHITPMITHDRDRNGKVFYCGATMYPRDCLEILRCRPFTFTHKVVNKWFHGRTVLIGDSAHVFPPFGGEGIASGIRDAHQLSWRIALAERATMDNTATEELLTAWMKERRQGIRNAADFTKLNGTLCNEPESWGFWVFRNVKSVLEMMSLFSLLPNPRSLIEAKGYRGLSGGWFLPGYDGGGKLAQIFVKSGEQEIGLSDRVLSHEGSLLTLFVLESGDAKAAMDTIRTADLPPGLLSLQGVVAFVEGSVGETTIESPEITVQPAPPISSQSLQIPRGYQPEVFGDRLRRQSTSYAIVRPDFYVFALLKTIQELEQAVAELGKMASAQRQISVSKL